MKKISKFQIIVLGLFVVFIVAGVIGFAVYKGSGSVSQLTPITIWGTFPKDSWDQYSAGISSSMGQQIPITYVQKTPQAFSGDFVNALAIGQGPDVILISADMLIPETNKLTVVPYTALPQRTFMDSYVDEAGIYLGSDGILAIPFVIDPLVMYWNKDSFNAAGIAAKPSYWDEFTGTNATLGIANKLVEKDQNGNIRKTGLAMGDFRNVTNGREILGTLFMQAGNPVTVSNGQGGARSALAQGTDLSGPAAALRYFTQFVDPSDVDYSWNGGLKSDKTMFLSGNLATYFGFASELADLRAKNPNLNFDISPMPQARPSAKSTISMKAAYGRIYGFSIVKASPNQNAAYQMISILTNPQYLSGLSEKLYLPSIYKSVIAQGSSDPYMTIFDQAALIAKTWLDADPVASKQIFSGMVQSVTSGKKDVEQAIQEAGAKHDIILNQR